LGNNFEEGRKMKINMIAWIVTVLVLVVIPIVSGMISERNCVKK